MEITNTRLMEIQAKAMENEKFLQEMVNAVTQEEVQKVFQKYGFEVSDEDVESLIEMGQKTLEEATNEGELCEDELDTVAGGGALRAAVRTLLGGTVIALELLVTDGVAVPGVYATASLVALWAKNGKAKKGW